jgi:serine/threonine protein kinase
MIGRALGPYQVVAKIGEGGMGKVYRAKDTKLNRDVAIKVLPDAFASDADPLGRFNREAQTLAALNHSNIAHIHGLERIERRPGARDGTRRGRGPVCGYRARTSAARRGAAQSLGRSPPSKPRTSRASSIAI